MSDVKMRCDECGGETAFEIYGSFVCPKCLDNELPEQDIPVEKILIDVEVVGEIQLKIVKIGEGIYEYEFTDGNTA